MDTPPIIIAGMHRSATSFLASIFAQLGFNLGKNLSNADINNQCGYFEDENFLEFNRQIFLSKLIQEHDSYIDWGWSSSQQITEYDLIEYEKRARELVQYSSFQKNYWGWKDPRNTILLNFWKKVTPKAVFVFIYRFPWEVADSMQRLASPVFLDKPDYAWKIWKFYNQKILDFYQKNQSQCLLISANSLAKNYLKLPQILTNKFSINVGHKLNINSFDPELFKTSMCPNIPAQIAEIFDPEALQILKQLETLADINSEVLWNSHSVLRFNNKICANTATPKVSVLIPCYNQGGFIAEALTSVEAYAPDETEIIILNDGSNDQKTVQILEAIAATGYQVLNQENKGLSQARNQMILSSKADYILPLDADNRICANFIENALNILEQQEQTAVVYGHRKEFGMRNDTINIAKFEVDNLLKQNFIDACAVIRKKAVLDLDGYDPKLKALEDWDLWLGLVSKKWEFANLDFTCFEYRVRPNSMVTKLESDDFRLECFKYIYQKHLSLFMPWLIKYMEELKLKLVCEAKIHELKLQQVEELHKLELIQADEIRKRMADELTFQSGKNENLIKQLEDISLENQRLINLSIEQQREIKKLGTKLANILNSKSWIYTEILRSYANRFRYLIRNKGG